ncbi:unnamed protein product [Anisakis simplex]|uniref:RING-type domain-containing protein n=1 Tax=Anisakis simplex TaxID=6269 RepID=A0A0M3K859_ANISI|nr:unnamed protein product [Anisakis simplex]
MMPILDRQPRSVSQLSNRSRRRRLSRRRTASASRVMERRSLAQRRRVFERRNADADNENGQDDRNNQGLNNNDSGHIGSGNSTDNTASNGSISNSSGRFDPSANRNENNIISNETNNSNSNNDNNSNAGNNNGNSNSAPRNLVGGIVSNIVSRTRSARNSRRNVSNQRATSQLPRRLSRSNSARRRRRSLLQRRRLRRLATQSTSTPPTPPPPPALARTARTMPRTPSRRRLTALSQSLNPTSTPNNHQHSSVSTSILRTPNSSPTFYTASDQLPAATPRRRGVQRPPLPSTPQPNRPPSRLTWSPNDPLRSNSSRFPSAHASTPSTPRFTRSFMPLRASTPSSSSNSSPNSSSTLITANGAVPSAALSFRSLGGIRLIGSQRRRMGDAQYSENITQGLNSLARNFSNESIPSSRSDMSSSGPSSSLSQPTPYLSQTSVVDLNTSRSVEESEAQPALPTAQNDHISSLSATDSDNEESATRPQIPTNNTE